jgi:hypothetical protein
MAENTGAPQPGQGQAQTPPAVTPPMDHRPRPRYGELAPEGWSWTPPQESQAPAASAPVSTNAAVPLGSQRNPAAASAAPLEAPAVRPAPAWDRPVTISLLFLGLIGTFFAVSILGSVPESLQLLYTQAELGDYTAAAFVAPLLLAGSILQGVIWVASSVAAVLLLMRGRRAFYVPLIGGIVAFVVLVATVAAVLTGDTALLEYFSRP